MLEHLPPRIGFYTSTLSPIRIHACSVYILFSSLTMPKVALLTARCTWLCSLSCCCCGAWCVPRPLQLLRPQQPPEIRTPPSCTSRCPKWFCLQRPAPSMAQRLRRRPLPWRRRQGCLCGRPVSRCVALGRWSANSAPSSIVIVLYFCFPTTESQLRLVNDVRRAHIVQQLCCQPQTL